MSQWGSSDSGILRKKRVEENLDQLLVFGYSCKIFRDDEKAQYIDQGKHLIPWMGDDSLKIDRYDGRGTLSDIRSYEASREGYDTLRWLGLSESEKKLEERCDRERYYSLEINEEEEEMYKEEVAKRQKTNAIAFDYNASLQPEKEEPEKDGIPTVPEKEEEDELYKPSPNLDVPVDINIPKTMKEYARIEKTALFVSRQGPQMEILIKAKQADNPQFSFLTVHDPLYKFYRHLLAAFKNGRYQPQCEKKPEANQQDNSESDDKNSHYLHPSLLSATAKPGTPPTQTQLTSVPYRPSADCAYSQLVNRIQGAGLGGNTLPDSQSPATVQQQTPNQMQIINQMTLEQQYHQYYYVQQFYEYWRHSVINSEQGALYSGLPMNFSQLDSNMQSYIHQLAWAQFVQHHQKQMQEAQQQAQTSSNNNNSYAQIVSNVNKDGINPYTANVPQLPPVKAEPTLAANVEKTGDKKVTLVKYDPNEVNKPLLSLAAYGSGSEDEDSEQEETVVKSDQSVKNPPSELQTVIDKMAEYVMKNGAQFEEIIKQKEDPRFFFLKPDHEFYPYYKMKLSKLRGEPEVKKAEEKKSIPVKVNKKQPISVVAPVSFSIKKPKEEHQKEIRSALPVEDSSDEEGEKSPANNAKVNIATPQVPVKTEITGSNTLSEELLKNKEIKARCPELITLLPDSLVHDKVKVAATIKTRSRSRTKSPAPIRKRKSRSKSTERNGTSPKRRSKNKSIPIDMFETGDELKLKNGTLEKDDPILEMLQLEKDIQVNREEKEADEKEKARRLERKRKAAMFLKLKSATKSPSRETKPRTCYSPSHSRRSSDDSVIIVRSRSTTREKSRTKEKSSSRCKSRSKSVSRSSRRSRSRERHRSRITKDRERSESRQRHEDKKKKKDKKKKSHKRKRSKSKKKSKRHRRSRSSSRSKRSRSRSSSVKSHISINSS